MKNILLLLLISCSAISGAFAQQTKSFSISGKVKKESTITIDSLKQYTAKDLGSINITNHKGDFKHKDDELQGVLLKDILSHTVFDVASPKLLSEFYFICIASDGYKVVYSWNELYNTETGNTVFIITEKNGIKLDAMPESIQMVSMQDFKTGRRYLHNLSKIVVGRAE
ncbi:MAG: molybdopterin-binding protein [Sphingobacteriales bacterium]|nr:MAG: molybdopterin-binding protein [Sphingobacteriales bacterium]